MSSMYGGFIRSKEYNQPNRNQDLITMEDADWERNTSWTFVGVSGTLNLFNISPDVSGIITGDGHFEINLNGTSGCLGCYFNSKTPDEHSEDCKERLKYVPEEPTVRAIL